MATSSIKKNFVISGKEQVEMFINALEASEQERDKAPRVSANYRMINNEADLVKIMEKWEKAHEGK
ncbi:MAG: hypothetical protein LUE87_05745 [Lachnospiraceae bacterium]|nr:hypothetical protein [Lachnospiraceae bacterium]